MLLVYYIVLLVLVQNAGKFSNEQSVSYSNGLTGLFITILLLNVMYLYMRIII